MGIKTRGSLFSGETIQFLGELELHNDRGWFNDNKHRYESFVREPARELVRDHDRQRHELGSFIRSVTKHHSLVPCSAGIDSQSNIRRLALDEIVDRTVLSNNSHRRIGVADILKHLLGNHPYIGKAVASYLTADNYV